MRILLVDDDETNLKLLQILFEGAGHAVVLAENGEVALRVAREALPDLVVSDILMPVMDGYALCREWIHDPALKDRPLIFYTATYLTEEDEAFALSLGAAAFLRKPMEQEQLVAAAEQAGQRAASTPRPSADLPPLEEGPFLKAYNQRLVHKLSQRTETLAQNLVDLKEAESQLRLKGAALDAAVNAIVIADRRGDIEWANPAFLEMTGLDPLVVVGSNLRVLRSGAHDAGFYRALWDTLLAGKVWQGEIVNRHQDGSLRTAQATITPLLDAKGHITHFIDIMQDITEQKRFEGELRQAQKMEAVGRLAGGVAHDFNNMLNVILMNTELSLLATDLSVEHRRHLQEIQLAAQRSAELTQQLLAFSRKQPAQPKPIDLNAVVAESQKMLLRLIAEDIRLDFAPGAGLWVVQMDPSQVTQILVNLVINARDALPGAGVISLETANIDVSPDSVIFHDGLAPGRYVQLTVSDTGCGMDQGTLEHIFEPFFSTKGVGQGTGLGLSTVYGIVKQNHGGIAVYSHPGVGTSMKIYLPRCLEGVREEPAEVDPPMPGGTETLLVAEDELPMLAVLVHALEERGYTVLATANPAEACQLAQHHAGSIDLLLTDVVMPGMNGNELHQRILQLRPDIKVLFMSGYTGDIVARRGLMDEHTHFLQKPFRLANLAQKVRAALDT